MHEYKTFEEARKVIFEFIESWYNRRRIYSAINYRTPEELLVRIIKEQEKQKLILEQLNKVEQPYKLILEKECI